MIRVRCCHCSQVYQVAEERLGSQATCKKCRHTFTLQTAGDETGALRAKSPSTAYVVGGTTMLPSKLGQYQLKQKLGAGAMGDVWLAHDSALLRDAALKLMAPGVASDPERRQRFEREARTAARLLHPNTVAVYSFGVEGDHAYLAMELVNGSSLDKVVSTSGALPWGEATRAIRDAAKGLAAAHEIGLVHRDVKPANLMRTTKGITKVVDFGLARAALSDTQLTQDGTLLGTPAYMAPEQWMGGEVDARSDLYSLICTYYYLLTGKLPFHAPSLPALGYQHRYEPFPDPRQFVTELPDAVCRILARGSQKDPAGRYQSADELVAELEAVLAAPDQSLLHGAPWQGLATAGGSSLHSQPAALSAVDLALPSLIVTKRPAARGKQTTNRLVWIGAAGGGLALLLGITFYVATNGDTTKAEPRAETVFYSPIPAQAAPSLAPDGPMPPSLPPTMPAAARSSTVFPPGDAQAFGGHRYKFFAEHVSWKEAKARCETVGGHLVIIESAEEQEFVGDLIAPSAWQEAWIGITDEASEGTWVTVMGRPVGYSKWFVNQPNNKGVGEHFVLISNRRALGQDIAWGWCDQPDRALAPHQPGYVCEWEPAAAASSVATNDWTQLFNGKDLSGWKPHPSDRSQWTVRDGWLMGGGPRGHLFSERDDYANFHFRVEARINNIGNSGQFFRAAYSTGFLSGYEAQISTSQPDQKTGSLYGIVKIPRQLHLPDVWFTQEVIADGNRIRILVNGEQVVDYRDAANTYMKGHLALQHNRPETIVAFRKVEVKEMK